MLAIPVSNRERAEFRQAADICRLSMAGWARMVLSNAAATAIKEQANADS
jgi:hypothetical protein